PARPTRSIRTTASSTATTPGSALQAGSSTRPGPTTRTAPATTPTAPSTGSTSTRRRSPSTEPSAGFVPARPGAQYRSRPCDSRAPRDRARGDSNREDPPVTDVMERVKAQQQFIGGQWVDSASGKTLDVENPANGQVIAQVPASDTEAVDRAVQAAAKAFETWQKTTPA